MRSELRVSSSSGLAYHRSSSTRKLPASMTEGNAADPKASHNDTVRRGLALVVSLLLIALFAAYLVTPAAEAGPLRPPSMAEPTIFPPDSSTTSTTEQTTTTRRKPTTTQPPSTTQTTAAPTTDPPETTDPPDDDDDEPVVTRDTEVETTETADFDSGSITTTQNLLKAGNGLPGSKSETAQAPKEEPAKGGSASDEDRVIWMIIAGLGAVALLVALLTWRYWLLTRPGLDLSDDGGPDDGGYDGGGYGGGGYDGGGSYGGGPPAGPGPGDPYATAAAPRMSEVNPMTTGMPPAPASTGWQDPPQGPPPGPQPGPPPQQRRGRGGGGRGAPPERGGRGRRGQSSAADDFFGPDGGQGGGSRGRGGRNRRGGDPFGWDDSGGQAQRRQPPPGRGNPSGQPRRRPDQGGRGGSDPWGRNPR